MPIRDNELVIAYLYAVTEAPIPPRNAVPVRDTSTSVQDMVKGSRCGCRKVTSTDNHLCTTGQRSAPLHLKLNIAERG